MPIRNSDAFVLTAHPLGEGDKICSLFTKEYGKVRAVASGARRPKSRFGASLEPLTEVQVTYYEKETRELVRLRGCDLLISPFEKAGTPEGEAFLHHLAELVDQFQPAHEPNGWVYRLLKATIEGFKQGLDLVALSAYFEVWILKLGGFFGGVDHCVICGRVFANDETIQIGADGAPGCLMCSSSPGMFSVQPTVRREISRLLRYPPSNWAKETKGSPVLPQIRQMMSRIMTNILERDLRTELILGLTK